MIQSDPGMWDVSKFSMRERLGAKWRRFLARFRRKSDGE